MKKLNLQLFADDEVKTFTQEDVDKIINARIAREKENFQKELASKELEWKEKTAKANADEFEQQKQLLSLEIEKKNLENKTLFEELAKYRKESRKSDVLTTYTKDNLPCSEEFANIVGLISNIEDDNERVNVYNAFKKYVGAIQSSYEEKYLKGQGNPSGSSGNVPSGDNPFTSENFTEILKLVSVDTNKAKELAIASGKYEKYKYLFKE